MTTLISLLTVVAALWLVTRFVLRGPSQAAFDKPTHGLASDRTEPSAEHQQVTAALEALFAAADPGSGKEQLQQTRARMDQMGELNAVVGEVRAVDAGGVPAEWVLPPDPIAGRRMLYIHGGAFVVGSPRSHRAATTEFADRFRAAVLAIDYRLMPEHPRRAGIEDCRAAYRWLLDNGPNGPEALSELLMAGDSAGGNLALVTAAWARDEGLRPANAIVAISPSTDSTMSSPSLVANQHRDVMLGPFLRPMLKAPPALRLWMLWLGNRIRPASPLVSPLHGQLAGLPPVLVHASDSEMIRDDAIRYVNKAKAAGSPVELGLWPDVLHAWHIFVRTVPEAQEAFDHIEHFVAKHLDSHV